MAKLTDDTLYRCFRALRNSNQGRQAQQDAEDDIRAHIAALEAEIEDWRIGRDE